MTILVLSASLSVNERRLEQVTICKYHIHEIKLSRDNQTHELERKTAFGKLKHVLKFQFALNRKILINVYYQ